MEISTYLNRIRNDSDALLTAAKSNPSAPVPTCPEWSLSTLVAHTGRAHRWAEEIVRTKATEFVAFPKSPKEFGDRYNWYEEGLGLLIGTLAAAVGRQRATVIIDQSTENTMNFAFYGRVSTEDLQDPTSSKQWQLSRATGLIEPHGGVVDPENEYFDIGQSRSLPWKGDRRLLLS